MRLTPIRLAVLSVLSSASGLALAQQDADVKLERVEITGSSIKRIDAETAVPVTVVKMDDLKKTGVSTVEQVLSNLAAIQQQTNTVVSSVGSGGGGASFADMRGIGADKTLVLLNGQRIANNAVDGSAPDLNMIPFAAIDRIEVLRDGASSLYGTDAIGGVVNFITRKDFRGGTITLGYDSPQHPGGKTKSINAGFGFGDIGRQNFNVMGFLSYKQQDNITGDQRDFNQRIAGGLSNSTFPANYTQDYSSLYNQAAPGCAGTALIPVAGGTQCKLVTSRFVDYIPKTDTISGMVKGTLRANDNLDLGLEIFASQNKVTTQIAPVPYGGYLMNPIMPNGQPNPYFPTAHVNPTFDDGSAGAPGFNSSKAFPNPVNVQPGFIYVFWRDFPNGNRAQENNNQQQRVLLTADGTASGWDYNVTASYNRNHVIQNLTGGYANGDMIGEGLLEGVINPFGPQTAAGSALLQQAALNGELQYATGTVQGVNAHASRELGDWFHTGHAAQIAIGLEARHEDFISAANTSFAELVAASTGVDPKFVAKGSRNVQAAYAELYTPVLNNLDVTVSGRFDRYSDFGSTTNPKLSVQYRPAKEVLMRGSISTGFRAPTLYELHEVDSFTNTAGSLNNPVNCPGGVPIAGVSAGANCNTQFQVMNGGNLHLRPEKSKSGTLGVVYQPISTAKVGLDFWWIEVDDQISSIPQKTLFDKYSQFQQYYHFQQPGNLLSITSNCPGPKCGYVDQTLQNLGGTNTNGVDLSAEYRLRSSVGTFDFNLNSTYVTKYEYQDYINGPWNQNVAVYSGNGPIFRWQHALGMNWSSDNFSAGGLLHYKSGYIDYKPSNTVSSYTTMDVFGAWNPNRTISLVLGIRNLFDRTPPFTNQNDLFQGGGWDSRFSDPTGRAYYLRGTYNF